MDTSTLGRLLIVDDEVELKTALCETLSAQGYDVVGTTSPTEALQVMQDQDFDLVLADLMMPEMDGVALLRAALAIDPSLVGIIMTGQGTVQTAVEAMQAGAFDYILKPFRLQTLLLTLSRAIGVRRLRQENHPAPGDGGALRIESDDRVYLGFEYHLGENRRRGPSAV